MKTVFETVKRWLRDLRREKMFVIETARQFYRGGCWIGYFAPSLPPRMRIDEHTALVCNKALFAPHQYPVPVWFYVFDNFREVEIGFKWIAWPKTGRAKRALWKALNLYLDAIAFLRDKP